MNITGETMPNLTKKIEQEVLSLPSEDRLFLTEKLIQSLNLPTEKDIEEQWAIEAEKRIKEMDKGIVKAIDGENVFGEIQSRLS